jgi:uncharacterized protein with von Willebrand factor type A (vWA) domain
MADAHAWVRVLDELLWVLRREGFRISTAQALTAVQAIDAVGLERAADVREALAAVVVDRASERPRFDQLFSDFFCGAPVERPSIWVRLAEAGFDSTELGVLRTTLEAMTVSPWHEDTVILEAWLTGGPEMDHLLFATRAIERVDAHAGPQLGFLVHRLAQRAGATNARRALAVLRLGLRAALGPRGDALADALARELKATEETLGSHLRRAHRRRLDELEAKRAEHRLETKPFSALEQSEIDRMRKAVRGFASRLAAVARLRLRRAGRHRLDPHATLRRALRTSGVPIRPAYRHRHPLRPKLLLLCDVSDSVRPAAAFLLDFVYTAHELFSGTRSFLFVSDVVEATRLFEGAPLEPASTRISSSSVVTGHNSNYGRALRTFETHHLGFLDRRTTVVILGDGRNNYFDPAAYVLDRIRRRARTLVWLATEPSGQWGQGDSAMAVYAPKCSAVLEVTCVADLEKAARVLSTQMPSAGG